MEDAQYFHRIVADAVWDDIRGTRDHQFSSTRYSAGPAHRRMVPESLDRVGNSGYDPTCCCWAIASDVLSLGVEIGDGFAQPSNAHRESIS
jgi:hypothetical protein